jgi:hypothetical protein
MKRAVTIAVAAMMVAGSAGVALAQGPYGPRMGAGWGGGWGMGRGPQAMQARMGGGGQFGCPMAGAAGASAVPGGEAVTEEKATELATAYAEKYFKGYSVERVLPFQGRFATMYQVELKGPKGEKRVLHVNPWGNVRPFGPLASAE